ncbi:MAG: (Fe-S)-binding protein [Phycisphaerae bacterium]|nr:(Fe-S)-binding protein [Phycisphaerae bacterium]
MEPGRCTECFRCLHACPTRAIRVRGGGPKILDYLCVDCTTCIAACPAGGLSAAGAAESVVAAPSSVLVAPPAFLAQFPDPGLVRRKLAELGFAEVRVTDQAERALRTAALDYAASRADENQPIFSPVCPAVVNLVATKFPSLLGSVAPFLSATESTRESLRGRRVTFVALCPSEMTLLQSGGGPAVADILTPAVLAAAIRPMLPGQPTQATAADQPTAGGIDPRVLRVTGMRHVANVLEMMENGLIREPAVLELYACDQGCFGSPFLKEDAFVSARRWQRLTSGLHGDGERPTPRTVPLRARAGLRLDDDMGAAIRKLADIDRVLKTLPGKDCGLCGCPTCGTLAEDIVMARAPADACVHQKPGRSAP